MLYRYIQAGGDNITKEFNLTRTSQELEMVKTEHFQGIEQRLSRGPQGADSWDVIQGQALLIAETDSAGHEQWRSGDPDG